MKRIHSFPNVAFVVDLSDRKAPVVIDTEAGVIEVDRNGAATTIKAVRRELRKIAARYAEESR